jgi:hypothetical protein
MKTTNRIKYLGIVYKGTIREVLVTLAVIIYAAIGYTTLAGPMLRSIAYDHTTMDAVDYTLSMD